MASGARSSWRLIREGIARFRDLGGSRAVLTNMAVRLDSATSSPTGPDDPCDLVCPPPVAAERLQQLCQLGFDDVVLVAQRYDAAHLAELRRLV